MELTPKQQATEFLRKSEKILILTPRADGDGLGAAIALMLTLKKLAKTITVVCQEETPLNLSFLPHGHKFQKEFGGTKDFIITLDCSQTPVEKLGYKIEDNKLNIIITPQRGDFSKENVNFSTGSYQYDLIVVLDCADLDMLGSLYDDNAEIFYETPVLNIDHHASNDHFGKVNLVEITATSTCEILVSILEALGQEKSLLDEDVATALLTGIISDTGSFQNSNTTPKSFTVAAQLVAAGGRQQEIIKHIYKTKPLSTLRLWGRILAQIREDKEHKFVWSIVSLRDLEQTGAAEAEIGGAIDELLTSAPEAEIILLLSEREDGIHGSIRTVKGIDAAEIAKMFGGGGHPGAAAFQMADVGLATAEREILTKIREYQAKRLGKETADLKPRPQSIDLPDNRSN